MVGALGGRLAAYRAALAPDAAPGMLEEALVRNVYRGEAPAPDALAHVATSLRAVHARLATLSSEALIAPPAEQPL